MATREFLEQRVKKAQENIVKINKRILRLRKELAMGQSLFGDSDLRHAERDLVKTQAKLVEYQKQLDAANARATKRNIPVITEFLNQWEAMSILFFEGEAKRYIPLMKEFSELSRKKHAAADEIQNSKEKWATYHKLSEEYRAFERKWNHVLQFGHIYEDEGISKEWTARMKHEVAKDKDQKYDFIIAKTNEYIGSITDASGLRIGAKGDLNGYIKGPKGTVHVQTVGAGGWNIQRFHFRTLFHKIK